MNFPFTKVLEVPVVLHKNIKDEDLLLFSYSYAQTQIFIVDRNDLNSYINNNPNLYAMYGQYIDFSKIQSTVIRENFYFGCETISYKYLDDNIGDTSDYPLFRNEQISAVRSTNAIFINHNYLKYKIIIKLNKKWISILDAQTRTGRFDHVAPDGQTVGVKDFFLVSGEQLSVPRDTERGSLGNKINCRCIASYEV